ncbi:hypothetical protein GP475_00255 [Corynebacterium poyangense]|uniref:Uncharacterized protein n=1 Tax=Corynebacterium poyangense TaxID=2684405 RepID=A0A7H0SL06_9CORY|nr:hypothetical protein [Corynebacterium poyangense]QNQ89231.1 hypothetical protein GP475_00255 [Corynebacterium poyangense]
MKIKFGLGLDGAAWSSQGSLGSIVAGPKAMTDVLSTRLGIRRPVSTPLDRTIAMEKSLKDILRPGMWAYQSFSVDPYGVASQLLDWRDELVAAGLDLKDPRLAEGSQRLQLLHHVELHQKLLPGESDLLSDVAQTLSQRLEQHWPLGIEDVISLEPISSMPWIWQKILQQLGAHEDCVELKTISDLPELEIISGDHEYAVADVVVGEIKGTEEPLQLLVGGPTDTLDAELRRAGLPSIGVGEYCPGGDQVLGSFVQLVTADDPVPALVDLLTLRVAGQRIWPDSINKFLVRALMRNYGCGAEWHRALEELADNEDYAQAVAFFSTYIWDSPLRLVSSEDLYDAEALATACDAFAEQLNGQAFSADRAAVTSLATVLREDYSSGISDREIHQLLAEVGGNTPSPVSLALANPNLDVIYDPAHIIPGSQVLWWRATAEKTAAADTFSQSELALIQEIAGAGSIPVVLSAKVFSELQGATRLAALAQARRVIAVCPQRLAGEELVVEHPLLDQLSALIRRRGLPEPRRVSAEEVLADSLSVVPGAHAPRTPDLRGGWNSSRGLNFCRRICHILSSVPYWQHL